VIGLIYYFIWKHTYSLILYTSFLGLVSTYLTWAYIVAIWSLITSANGHFLTCLLILSVRRKHRLFQHQTHYAWNELRLTSLLFTFVSFTAMHIICRLFGNHNVLRVQFPNQTSLQLQTMISKERGRWVERGEGWMLHGNKTSKSTSAQYKRSRWKSWPLFQIVVEVVVFIVAWQRCSSWSVKWGYARAVCLLPLLLASDLLASWRVTCFF